MKINSVIKKSNRLINAKFKLGINEQKILYMLISQIHVNDKDFETYEIKTSDLIRFIGTKSKTIYEDIERYTYNLLKEVLIFKKDDITIQTNWFSIVKHVNKNKILFSFHPILKPYLLNLKEHFTRFQIEIIRNFKGKYTPRIYELLKQEEYRGHRKITLEEFRELLVLGKSYNRYNDFKKDILLKAQREIIKNSDITFDFQEIKEGRKIVAIMFYIKQKKIKSIENIKEKGVEAKNNNEQTEFIEIKNEDVNRLKASIENVLKRNIEEKKVLEWIMNNKTEDVNKYLNNWSKWSYIDKVNPVGFFIKLVDLNKPIPEKQQGQTTKPVQATNYEQREYDDDFFNSLYDNVQFVKNQDNSKTIENKEITKKNLK